MKQIREDQKLLGATVKKFSRHGDTSHDICAPTLYSILWLIFVLEAHRVPRNERTKYLHTT